VAQQDRPPHALGVEQGLQVRELLRDVHAAGRFEAALAAAAPIRGDDAEVAGRRQLVHKRGQLATGRERGMEHHDERGQTVAELAPAQLAGGCPGQGVEAGERDGYLVGGQACAAPLLEGVVARVGEPRREDDPGDRTGPPRRVRAADHAGLRHGGVGLEGRLDLGRMDVLTARDDEVGAPVGDEQPGRGIEAAESPVRSQPSGVIAAADSASRPR
jgi:hypothetical protein